MRLRTLAALLLFAALAAAGCRAPRGESDVARRLSALVEDLHRRGLFDGAIVVERSGAVVWQGARGFADREHGIPFTVDTAVDGASLAKTFTAALILMLADEGRLDLDRPARELVPELPYAEVTVRHLLTHCSGLPAYYEGFEPFLSPLEPRTTERLLGILAAQRMPLAFPPGSRFEYSSFAYDVAALVAARAAGSGVAELFRQRLFAPLGLGSAFLRPARFADWPGPRTLAYRQGGAGLEPNDVFDLEAFHGGSNIYLSARDLTRWNTAFFDDAFFGRRVLARGAEPATIAAGRSGLTLLNWYRSPDGSASWYSGHLQGFHSIVFRDLQARVSIVVVSNDSMETWLQHAIVRGLRETLAGRRSEELTPPQVTEIAESELGAVVGSWRFADGSVIRLDHEGGALFVTSTAHVRYPMFHVNPSSFYAPGLDDTLGFARDGAGAIARLRRSTNLGVDWATRLR